MSNREIVLKWYKLSFTRQVKIAEDLKLIEQDQYKNFSISKDFDRHVFKKVKELHLVEKFQEEISK